MNEKAIFGLMALVLVTGCTSSPPEAATTHLTDLDTPWAIEFLPEGAMLITERPGMISQYNGSLRQIAVINVTEISESGLLGAEVHPAFAENNFVYLYYTYESDGRAVNRVSRFKLAEGRLNDETIIIGGIPSARFHNGGRIEFGPDGKLYVTTGDATKPSSAQDKDSLAGKILRVNDDGTIPEDNPFGNAVYSFGHRNPQGITWMNGVMFSSEHGPNRHDEINIIEKGGNYGWPSTCNDQPDDTIEPIRCYVNFTLAPGGIEAHAGSLYVTGLRSEQLRRIDLGHDMQVVNEKIVLDNLGRLRAVTSFDGLLYVSTSNQDGRGIPHTQDDKIIDLELGG